MNTCVLLLGVIESARKPALRIGFTIPLLLLMGAGVFIYRRREQLFGRDPDVEGDTPVVRHNRLEEIILIGVGVTFAVVSALYRLWFD